MNSTPVAIGESFGWLHHADGDRGVVMCASIGYEGLCAHQSWRVLADRLAAAGLPTLRFDYPGEGDSLGDPADPALVDSWREQIHMAVRWMREAIGVREVTLVGLRLGAALAAEVGGVERLVQIAPVVKGSSYLRELKMMARVLAASGATPEASIAAATSGDDIHLEGFAITQSMAAAIKRIDLTRLEAAPAERVLLLHDPAARPAPEFLQRLESLGAIVETLELLDYRALTPAPVPPPPPLADLDAIVAFASEGAGRALTSRPPEGALATEHFIERAALFGERRQLAGVLCLPRGKPKMTVLMLDTGANHHIGCGRSTVYFARSLARHGFASLRMDTLGIGDSAALAEGPRAALYQMERAADVSAALDFLEMRGLEEVTLYGVCSGAALALYAALADDRVKALALANLQVFGRIDGEDRDKLLEMGFAATHTYVAKAMSARAWGRVVNGEVSLGKLVDIASSLARRKASAFAGALAQRLGVTHGKAREARANFAELSARGVRILMLHGDHDVGREEMDVCFGPDARFLRTLPNVVIDVVDGADHALSSALSREALLEKMSFFLLAADRSADPGRGNRKTTAGALTLATLYPPSL
ncbi:MAG TPA: alpha/beta fold hydrolase [Methylosinus sp.]|jgi:pimeloyl-ACP methyl ester carboxylesterase|uniref:alpha/beta fold hydrolase n=1 Tax=Methylosinus sp. TaxID=427 RepID=UPI002F92EE2C